MPEIKRPDLEGRCISVDYYPWSNQSTPTKKHIAAILSKPMLKQMMKSMDAREKLDLAYGMVAGHGYQDIRKQAILEAAESIAEDNTLDKSELSYLAKRLADFYRYQNCMNITDEQKKAVNVSVKLANKHDIFLDRMIEEANDYARVLRSYEDADPYNPNSFDVLARVRNSRVENFLAEYAKGNWGLVRSQALESLAQNCPTHPVILKIQKDKSPYNEGLRSINVGRNARDVY